MTNVFLSHRLLIWLLLTASLSYASSILHIDFHRLGQLRMNDFDRWTRTSDREREKKRARRRRREYIIRTLLLTYQWRSLGLFIRTHRFDHHFRRESNLNVNSFECVHSLLSGPRTMLTIDILWCIYASLDSCLHMGVGSHFNIISHGNRRVTFYSFCFYDPNDKQCCYSTYPLIDWIYLVKSVYIYISISMFESLNIESRQMWNDHS
jgi:hypothetical protein